MAQNRPYGERFVFPAGEGIATREQRATIPACLRRSQLCLPIPPFFRPRSAERAGPQGPVILSGGAQRRSRRISPRRKAGFQILRLASLAQDDRRTGDMKTSSAPVCALEHLPRARGRLCGRPKAAPAAQQKRKDLFDPSFFSYCGGFLPAGLVRVCDGLIPLRPCPRPRWRPRRRRSPRSPR